MRHALAHLTLFASVLALSACAPESAKDAKNLPPPPSLESLQQAQVSGGWGFSIYHFEVDSVHVGSLLVTNGAYGGSYADEVEYWRWEPSALADLGAGLVSHVDVDYRATAATWDSGLVSTEFETGTGTWTSWEVNRLFDLAPSATIVWNSPAQSKYLYRLEADAWGGESGTITYYLSLDFSASSIPEMYWYISAVDYGLWRRSEKNDDDSDLIYEVRLTSDTELDATAVGVGYRLKTLK
ncbi:MAG: hypothetical protein KC620_11360 [Myxococcales bacterium]|nr:hypothetical protein [Myxococcales bacterium]